jgi:hypothetical protein
MSGSHRRLSGLAVLLAGWVGGCGDGVTKPGDSNSLVNAVVVSPDCTFGAGHWKTHPDDWPARLNPATIFHTSGQSWVDVLNTPPRGNAYYILAHQFIAAALNLERIDPSLRPREIGEPFDIADRGFFTDPAHSDLTRAELLTLASLFESFNQGERGVRACRE